MLKCEEALGNKGVWPLFGSSRSGLEAENTCIFALFLSLFHKISSIPPSEGVFRMRRRSVGARCCEGCDACGLDSSKCPKKVCFFLRARASKKGFYMHFYGVFLLAREKHIFL